MSNSTVRPNSVLIKRLRISAGFATLEELANTLRMSKNTLSKCEKGVGVRASTLKRLAEEFYGQEEKWNDLVAPALEESEPGDHAVEIDPSRKDVESGPHRRLDDAISRLQQIRAERQSTDTIRDELKRIRNEVRASYEPRAGDALGRFSLFSKLGEGAFGTVWKARDNETGDDVAVKVLFTNVAGDQSRLDRFRAGVMAMKQLKAPGVVEILEGPVEVDGYQCVVMELLEGGDLFSFRQANAFDSETALSLVVELAKTVAQVHDEGLTHRDIKPQNVLLTDDRHVKLTDFDLVVDPNLSMASRGAYGAFVYAAPEQWLEPFESDSRSDVYSLALVGTFMITGIEPTSILMDREGFIDALPVHEAIRDVMSRASLWDRDLRYKDAAEFCDALTRAIQWDKESRIPEIKVSLVAGAHYKGHDIPPLVVGTSPVTQMLYRYVCKRNPGRPRGDYRPVNNVSWHDAIEFCNALSEQNNLEPVYVVHDDDPVIVIENRNGYRLLESVEWEYLAVGAEERLWPWGSESPEGRVCWQRSALDGPCGVGEYPQGQTPEGIGDLIGNVWEWCWDEDVRASEAFVGNAIQAPESAKRQRILRGGSFVDSVAQRIEARVFFSRDEDYRRDDVGFRICRRDSDIVWGELLATQTCESDC